MPRDGEARLIGSEPSVVLSREVDLNAVVDGSISDSQPMFKRGDGLENGYLWPSHAQML